MTIKEIRKISGLSQIAFGQKYNIPVQTIKKWEAEIDNPNHRTCPMYVNQLLERVVKMDFEGTSVLQGQPEKAEIDPALSNVIATLAIEDMYLSPDFVSKLQDVSEGRISSEDLRQEVLQKYAR